MVQGLAEFRRRWNAVPAKVRAEVKKAMEDVAEEIVAQMYSVAPHLTGDLAGSINWTWGDAPKGAMTIGTVGKTEYATMRITIYAADGLKNKEAYYARFQEFGTVKMAANPFFFPVWRAKRKNASNRISRAISKAIRST